jgi:hypothetical protein
VKGKNTEQKKGDIGLGEEITGGRLPDAGSEGEAGKKVDLDTVATFSTIGAAGTAIPSHSAK